MFWLECEVSKALKSDLSRGQFGVIVGRTETAGRISGRLVTALLRTSQESLIGLIALVANAIAFKTNNSIRNGFE